MNEALGEQTKSTGELSILHLTEGDVKIKWDKDKPDEVAIACEAFKKAKDKGMLMYKMKKFGESKGEQIHEFDPSAERILAIPKVQGG